MFEVKLLLPEVEVPEPVVETVPVVEVEEPQNETIEDIESELLEAEKKKVTVKALLMIGIIVLIVLVVVVMYIFWRRGNKGPESTEAPFFK